MIPTDRYQLTILITMSRYYTKATIYLLLQKNKTMVKLIHHEMPERKTSPLRKLEKLVTLILLVSSMSYLLYSLLSHDPDNPLCQCLLCAINHTPEDGEYLYNRYLVIISFAWTSTIFCLLLLIKPQIEKRHKKTKRREGSVKHP